VADQRITAEDLTAAVRVHADRVHDFVRRLGCAPDTAAEVVETSAMDLVKAAANTPKAVGNAIGWWFDRARALSARVAGGTSDLPLGGGLLSADAEQTRVAEALEALPERERIALLLRDSYALSTASVGVALGTDGDAAMETAGRGRLRFLQSLGDELPATSGHPVELAALARLGEGGQVAARDATPRRHAQSCQICRAVWDCQQRAHLLLAGLTVAALPEGERDRLLARVDTAAKAALPSSAALLVTEDSEEFFEEDEPSRWTVPVYASLAVVLAVLLGLGIGLLASRGSSSRSTGSGVDTSDPGVLPPVLPSPLPRASVTVAAPPPTAAPATSTRVFTVEPSPTAAPASSGPASAAPPPEPAADPLSLTSNPTSGPNGQELTVQGTGWMPGGMVTLEYVDPLGRQTGSRATQTVDARGRFTTTLSAQDPSNLPGRHTIRATDGTNTASASYDVNG